LMKDQLRLKENPSRKRLRRLGLTLAICIALLAAGLALSYIHLSEGPVDNIFLTPAAIHNDNASISRSKVNTPVYSEDQPGGPDWIAGLESGGDAASAGVAVTIIFYGDVNLDSYVNVGDAILLLRNIVGLAELYPPQKVAGEVSGDGLINVGDAILILRYIVGLIDNFPVEK
jgi:hypothetical protein